MEPKGTAETYKAVIIFALMLLLGSALFFWRAGFFSNPACSTERPALCESEEMCSEIGLYWWDFSCHLSEMPIPQPSQFPDYDYFKQISEGNKFTLISSHASYAPTENPNMIVGRFTRRIKVSGRVSDGYLYAKVSVDNNGEGQPLKVFDSLFVNLNYINASGGYVQAGGHLLRSLTLKIPETKVTELLYNLKEIPYLISIPYSENLENPTVRSKLRTTNWLTLLNSISTPNFDTFLSTSRKGGLIEEITVAYICEQDTQCSIEWAE